VKGPGTSSALGRKSEEALRNACGDGSEASRRPHRGASTKEPEKKDEVETRRKKVDMLCSGSGMRGRDHLEEVSLSLHRSGETKDEASDKLLQGGIYRRKLLLEKSKQIQGAPKKKNLDIATTKGGGGKT